MEISENAIFSSDLRMPFLLSGLEILDHREILSLIKTGGELDLKNVSMREVNYVMALLSVKGLWRRSGSILIRETMRI